MSTRCRYPPQVVWKDYLRAGAGAGLFLAPLALLSLPWPTHAVFSLLAGLFGLYGLQSYRRQRIRIEVSDEGLKIAPGNRVLAWRALTRLALAYFSVRREGGSGWMELKLVAEGVRVRVDSRLDGFTELTRRAARAAAENRLPLDSATLQNLAALGIPLNEDGVAIDRRG